MGLRTFIFTLVALAVFTLSVQSKEVTIEEVVVKPGGSVATIFVPLPRSALKLTEGTNLPHSKLQLNIVLPKGFDPDEPAKYLLVWRNSVFYKVDPAGNSPAIQDYQEAALANGWAVFTIDSELGHPRGKGFQEIIEFGFETLEDNIPNMKDSIFAMAGQVYGAKNATQVSGIILDDGHDLMGLCLLNLDPAKNDIMDSQNRYGVRASKYKSVKVFVANPADQPSGLPQNIERLKEGLDECGIKDSRLTLIQGKKEKSEAVASALKWFAGESDQ